jgi:predicted kinase
MNNPPSPHTPSNARRPALVVVSGYTGSGKSTLADALGRELNATVASFDWLMSALRTFPSVWEAVELPVEHQREVGWELLSRVAELQLRRGSSVVLDLVAQPAAVRRWQQLAAEHNARFQFVECTCSDQQVQLDRTRNRTRNIPGWYELTEADVRRSRERYQPIEIANKIIMDSMQDLQSNVATVLNNLGPAHTAHTAKPGSTDRPSS